MKYVLLTIAVAACTSEGDPHDAAVRDASESIDATGMDARIDDAAHADAYLDAHADAHGDAHADAPHDSGLDATLDAAVDGEVEACVAVRVGGYEVDGIPLGCPVGAGDAPPAPVLSYVSTCTIRITPDPVLGDRLVLEGELRVDGAMLTGTLTLNGVATECAGFVEDDVLALDCGECDVRLRAR